MNKPVLVVLAVTIAFVSAYIGYRFAQYRQADVDQVVMRANPLKENNELIGQLRPQFSLPDLSGKLRDVSEWDGNVIAINFWATWCPPCRDEIPEFIKLQEKYADKGLQFIGIALQTAEDVHEFYSTMGMNYPVLTGEEEVIKIATDYGNGIGALPYTAIIDRNSRIVFLKRGPLSRQVAEEIISSLL